MSGGGRAIQFTPTAPFAQGARIAVIVDSKAKDLFGNALSTYSGSFVMEDDEGSAPAVEFTSPSSGAVSVPTNTVIDVRLSEPLNPATVTSATISLSPEQRRHGRAHRPLPARWKPQEIRLVPAANLDASTSYFIQVTNGLGDTQGNPMPSTQNFFSRPGRPPMPWRRPWSCPPPHGETNVGSNAVVRVTFTEPINPITVTASTIRIANASFTAMAANIGFDSTFTDVTITPLQPLPDNQTLSVTIDGVRISPDSRRRHRQRRS